MDIAMELASPRRRGGRAPGCAAGGRRRAKEPSRHERAWYVLPVLAAPDQPAFDVSVAHQARIYNYWLGGTDHYPADRKAAEAAIAAYPGVVTGARANRQFLARAVGHLTVDAGIRQF